MVSSRKNSYNSSQVSDKIDRFVAVQKSLSAQDPKVKGKEGRLKLLILLLLYLSVLYY